MAKKHRAYWKGYLRLSLVTIGVEIYNAVESKNDISFRQIHKPSGKRVHYNKVVDGIDEVDAADIVKGYEVDSDTYITVEQEELDALKLDSRKTIDLVQFVDASEVDYRFFERPYFIGPADALAGEGYVVIRDALKETGKLGLAQVTIGGREWLVAISPMDDGLVMELLRYNEELREPGEYFDEVPSEQPPKEMLDLAVQLIEKKSSPFKPEQFKDRYQEALKDLIEKKKKGKKVIAPADDSRGSRANVIDLMEALKKSVGKKEKTRTTSKKAPSKSSKSGASTRTKRKA